MMYVPRLFYVCLLTAFAAQISANPIESNYDEPEVTHTDGAYDETVYTEPTTEVTEEATNDYTTWNNYDSPTESTDEAVVAPSDESHDEITDETNSYVTEEANDETTNEVSDAEPQLEARSLYAKRLRDTTADTETGSSGMSYAQEVAAKMAMSVDPSAVYEMSHDAMLRAVRSARNGATVAYDVTDKTVDTLKSMQDRKKQLIEDYVKPVAPTLVSSVIDKVEGGLDVTLDGMKKGLKQGRELANGALTDLEGRLERGESILPTAVQNGVERVGKAIGSWVYGEPNDESDVDSVEDQAEQEKEDEFKKEQEAQQVQELKAAQELKEAQEAREQERKKQLKAAQELKEQELKQQALKAAQDAQEAQAAKEAMAERAQFAASAGRGGRVLGQGQAAGGQGRALRRGSSRFARSFRLMA